jgi:hypothetical protein
MIRVMRTGYAGPEWAWLKALVSDMVCHPGLDPESRDIGFPGPRLSPG